MVRRVAWQSRKPDGPHDRCYVANYATSSRRAQQRRRSAHHWVLAYGILLLEHAEPELASSATACRDRKPGWITAQATRNRRKTQEGNRLRPEQSCWCTGHWRRRAWHPNWLVPAVQPGLGQVGDA